ncbi:MULTISPECIES: DUF4352 domain-containing protein [Nocardia]|uniref:DUF4352 domain-containing protein n=1 Tax=Nocardia TaxID=1817 RepID=UPI002458CBDF|nr:MULTISPECIES: DUF4352 domain-containing protein [Nocardia]
MTGPQYPQQPYGQQPHPQPYPQPPKKKTLVWPWIAFALVLMLCGFGGCVAIVSGGSDDTSSPTSPGAPGPKPSSRSSIAPAGSAVRDGKFEFVVTGVDAPTKTVGSNQFLKSTAQGEYILVHVTISNIGDEPRGYYSGNQKLIDAAGREFTNDSRAEINVNDHLHTDINPGNKVDMVLVFDVPAGAEPATLELHDSAFSGGVKVALR